jgi:flagellar hook-associated protein 1 FlgK
MLNGAMFIGRTGLNAGQVGMNVAGNNIANAATAGYSRNTLDLAALQEQPWGRLRMGRGVDVLGIRRAADDALQQRLWQGTSNDASAQTTQQRLGELEGLVGSLDSGLSSQLRTFFNAWSDLASNPSDSTRRSNVIAQGAGMARYVRDLRRDIAAQQDGLDQQLRLSANRADGLLQEIAALNLQVVTGGGASSSAVMDRRDQLVTELATLADITVVNRDNGSINVLIGSTPVVEGAGARRLGFDVRTVDGRTEAWVITSDNNQRLPVISGQIGALLDARAQGVGDTLARLDTVAQHLMQEVNRVHAGALPFANVQSLTGAQGLTLPEQALALNDPTNESMQRLPFAPTSGTITVRVRNNATGDVSDVNIPVDLDGLTSAGAPGFGDDTSMDDLRAALGAIPNLTATITPDGRLSISAAGGYSVGFTADTSGALTSLGINSFFTGTNAGNIDVRADLQGNPSLLNVRTVVNGSVVDNGAALAVKNLADKKVAGLGDATIGGAWGSAIQDIGVKARAARTTAEAQSAIRKSLEAQKAAVTGVSLDEEAINLVLYQTQYQASARYISVVQELTQTLLGLV